LQADILSTLKPAEVQQLQATLTELIRNLESS
jgi:hypothetical protein